MSYRTKRYREGLQGKKPGLFPLDKGGRRAQEAGYRDHLRNERLAEAIRESRNAPYDASESSSSYSSASEPLTPTWKAISWIVGSIWLFFVWAFYLQQIPDELAKGHIFAVLGILVVAGIWSLPVLWYWATVFDWLEKSGK